MLHLTCMKLRAWPAGVGEMSGLQYLNLYSKSMQNQDLAALQHIPHVILTVRMHSTFLMTSGSWQSLEISGWRAGFSVNFSYADAFVKDTKRFLFVSRSQEAQSMYAHLRAACARQWVACHECEHLNKVARLGNVRLCQYPDPLGGAHESLISIDEDCIWPDWRVYPELYTQT